MRNVALFASQLGGYEFNKYWPAANSKGVDGVHLSDEMRKQILKNHKLEL